MGLPGIHQREGEAAVDRQRFVEMPERLLVTLPGHFNAPEVVPSFRRLGIQRNRLFRMRACLGEPAGLQVNLSQGELRLGVFRIALDHFLKIGKRGFGISDPQKGGSQLIVIA